MVKEVASKEEFDRILSESGDKLVVVDFTATWCGPCKAIAPDFQRLSETYPEAVFIKVDVDKNRAFASAQKISAMPTFKFFKRGILFHQFRGASVQKLEEGIKKYAPADAEPNPDAELEGGSGRTSQSTATLRTVVPLIGSSIGVGTIVLVYWLTLNAGHLPKGISTPPISLLGCQSPEHEAYQVGFVLTGCLLLWSLRFYSQTFFPLMRDEFPSASLGALYGGYCAAVGVIGQGLVTLEEDFYERTKRGEGMALQSICHQILASLFFIGAAFHCYTACYLCYFGGGSISSLYSTRGRRVKVFCLLVTFVSYPIAEVLHPATTRNLSHRRLAVGGVMQYVTVGAYIVFFGSYSFDFLALQKRKHEPSLLLDKQD